MIQPNFKHRLLSASVASFLLKIFSTATGFCSAILLARLLGPGDYGAYVFTLSVIALIGLPIKAGLPQLIIRETAKYYARGDTATIKGLWRWSNTFVISGSLLLLSCVIPFWYVFSSQTDSKLHLILIGTFIIPVMGIAMVRASVMRGLGFVIHGQIPDQVVKPLIMLLMIMWFYFSSSISITPLQVILLNLTCSTFALIYSIVIFHKYKLANFSSMDAKYSLRSWISAIIPLAAINAMHLINTQADILFIGILLDQASVGVYKVAAQISLLVAFGIQSTKIVVEPYLTASYERQNWSELKRLSSLVSLLNVLVALFSLALLIKFGKLLIQIGWGIEFLSAYEPLLVLCTGWLIGAIFTVAGQTLVMSGHEKVYLKVRVYSVVINIFLNIVLIPFLGILGAALATSFSMAIFYFGGWYLAMKTFSLDLSAFGCIQMFIKKRSM